MVPVPWMYLRFKHRVPPPRVVVIIVPIIIYYYHHSRRTYARARAIGRMQRRLVVVVVDFPTTTTTWGMGSGGSDVRTRLCRRSPPSSPGDVIVTRGWWFTTTTTTTYSFTKLSDQANWSFKKKNHPCTLETPPPLKESRTRYTPPPDEDGIIYCGRWGEGNNPKYCNEEKKFGRYRREVLFKISIS